MGDGGRERNAARFLFRKIVLKGTYERGSIELIRVNRSFDYRVAFFEYIYLKEVVKIAREILRIACFFSFD